MLVGDLFSGVFVFVLDILFCVVALAEYIEPWRFVLFCFVVCSVCVERDTRAEERTGRRKPFYVYLFVCFSADSPV